MFYIIRYTENGKKKARVCIDAKVVEHQHALLSSQGCNDITCDESDDPYLVVPDGRVF